MTDGNRTAAGTADSDVLRTIREHLDETLFVEAGAGTGKTYALVERIVSLLTSEKASMPEIAAITFTKPAAAELTYRIRLRLTEMREDAGTPGSARQLCEKALGELYEANISTLHSFAKTVLAEHPLEAGLPPVFEVLDEVESKAELNNGWRELCRSLYADPAWARMLSLSVAVGQRAETMYPVAVIMRDNWDRLRGESSEMIEMIGTGEVIAAARRVLAGFEAALAFAPECADGTDRLLLHLRHIAARMPSLRRAVDGEDETAILRLLRNNLLLKPVGKVGKKTNWPAGRIDDVRTHIEDARNIAIGLVRSVAGGCQGALLGAVRDFTRGAVEERRRTGRLDFHDLLVLAVDLLRSDERVRRELHVRWKAILIDEFQDTDPLQLELARLLAVPPGGTTIAPGRLFFVGDPKQSIYRFRRADIRVYHAAKASLHGIYLSLDVNRRSHPQILQWVNEVCGELIGDGDGESQPAYISLRPVEDFPHPDGERVRYIGGPAELNQPEIRRREADGVAETCARAVAEEWQVRESRRAGEQPGTAWRPARYGDIAVLVPTRNGLHELTTALDEKGVPYRLESSSLTLATQEVRDLLSILRALDDPHDAVSVVATLRSPAFACSDTDLFEFHEAGGAWNPLVPFPGSIAANHAVVVAMGELRALHAAVWIEGAAGMVGRIIRTRRLFELALMEGGPRGSAGEAWQRIRYVLDLARRFSRSHGGSLRDFMRWVEPQLSGRVTLSEPGADALGVPDGTTGTSTGAVRVMTVHAAKGLEFPITVLAGFDDALRKPQRPRFVWGSNVVPEAVAGAASSRVGAVETPGYAVAAAHEAAMEEYEKIRLAYVAMTRARDHLVVSLHHKEGKGVKPSIASMLWELVGGEVGEGQSGEGRSGVGTPVPIEKAAAVPADPDAAAMTLAEREEWIGRRAALLRKRGDAPVISATAVAHALSPAGGMEEVALTLPTGDPTLRSPEFTTESSDDCAYEIEDDEAMEDMVDGGPDLAGGGMAIRRSGRVPAHSAAAIGRAVHAAMQEIDFDTSAPAEMAAEVAAMCAEAGGVPERAARIEGFVRSALRSSYVQRARETGRYWRELYVAAPVGGTLLEGYVDLLVEDESGDLCIVDYKTDEISRPGRVEELTRHYRFQCAAYALALGEVLGRPVRGAALVFLRPDGASPAEQQVEGLEEVVREVRDRVALPTGTQ